MEFPALSMEGLKEGTVSIPENLTNPKKWLQSYSDFITKNAGAVSQIESGLRSLTYIIPVHSVVQVLSLYHDSLLAKAVARLPALQKHQPTPHSRYTKFWSQKSSAYRRIAMTLQMIQYTELLWEMAAKRKGEKVRWRVVVLLEIVKAACRLLLLRLTNSRPLVSPPLPEREVDPAALEERGNGADEAQTAANDGLDTPESERSSWEVKWAMPRTGLSLPSLPDSHDISNYLVSKVLTADDIKPPKSLLHRAAGKSEVAEWLHILRPVIFALAMQHWRNDKRNWRPWLIGLSVEWGARQVAKKDFHDRFAGGLRGLTGLEKEELRKRAWSLSWWLMRGAFYENVTKLKGKPLLDMIGVVVEDYEFLWDEYYFSTATM
ncbi:MAG: Peroxisomal membrane protein pex16 [Alyxoria varia]|nr:MAG: Peroxisomal membrane protein pex16 [Alyxoria varia]